MLRHFRQVKTFILLLCLVCSQNVYSVENLSSYGTFETYLHECSGCSFEEDEDVIRTLFEKQNVINLINSILENDETLLKIQNQSYHHANGFMKINLFKSSDYSLRLHLYLPFYFANEYHDHRWDFHSAILTGSLKQSIAHFTGKEDGVPYKEYLYCRDTSAANEYKTRYLQPVYLKVDEPKVYKSGTCYSLERKTLHTILPSDDPFSATLVYYKKPYSPTCHLYCTGSYYDKTSEHKKRVLTKEELLLALHAIKAHILNPCR